MKEWVLTPERFLSDEELAKLLRRAEELRALGVAKNRKGPVRDWLIIRLALFSGLREAEMCSLSLADCYIGYGRSDLVVRCGKGGKTRVVRIGPDLKRDLRWFIRWQAQQGEMHPGDYLLRSQKSDRLSTSGIYRRWKKYCPNHRLHDARHSHATALYSATKDLRLVQKQLGHSRPSITAIYADVADVQAREGVKAMEKVFKNAGKGLKVGVSSPQPCVSP